MILNYLRIAFRSLLKNKLYILINIAGMAVAIGCCIVAYFNYEFNVTFDDYHENRASIYRVNTIREFEGKTTVYGYTPIGLGPAIRENVNDVEHVVRYSKSYTNFKKGVDLFPSELAYVDSTFFNVFTVEMLQGNASVINDRTRILISDVMATRLFGKLDVVGEHITQIIGSKEKEVEIGGVFKQPPPNTSFDTKAFMLYDNYFDEITDTNENDWKYRNTLFVYVPDQTRLESVTRQIQPYIANNNKVREDFIIKEFVLDPLTGMGRRDSSDRIFSWTNDASSDAAVFGPLAMAIMVLLIACFNLTNTTIAVSSRRLKEIGIRKVMGSLRIQLVFQFIGETMLICMISLLLGILLGEQLIQAWNELWVDMKLTPHYLDTPGFLIFVVSLLFIVGILAGSYPAFYITRFEPVTILKDKLKFGGSNFFTSVLLVLQYAISLVAIVSAVAFIQNARYQRDFNMGFNQQGVISAYIENEGEFETYRNLINQNPDILSIAGAKHSVHETWYSDPVKYNSLQCEADIHDVGDNYLKTLGLTLLQGRDFRKDSETDRKESVIVSEEMVRVFGWDEPIGKRIVWNDTVSLYVIGVVKDVYNRGLWVKMEPVMFRYTTPDQYRLLSVSAPAGRIKEVNAFMESKWKELFPNRLYDGRIIDNDLVETTMVNNNIATMFTFFGVVAMMLCATGLFSLVSLNILKRMKEMGVRKVLGASVLNITGILNTPIVIVLFVASVLGSLLGFLMVDSLMSGIWMYYQTTNVITFVVAIMLMFLISALTICFKVYGVATMNPVKTLRAE